MSFCQPPHLRPEVFQLNQVWAEPSRSSASLHCYCQPTIARVKHQSRPIPRPTKVPIYIYIYIGRVHKLLARLWDSIVPPPLFSLSLSLEACLTSLISMRAIRHEMKLLFYNMDNQKHAEEIYCSHFWWFTLLDSPIDFTENKKWTKCMILIDSYYKALFTLHAARVCK